jgi:hypothetical protein
MKVYLLDRRLFGGMLSRFLLACALPCLASGEALPQNALWGRLAGNSSSEDAFDLARDAQGNLYLAGRTMGPLEGQRYAGKEDAIVIRFDASGHMLWTREWGAKGNDVGCRVAVDSRQNVYVGGIFQDTLDGQASRGEFDIFLIKFDSQGKKIWTRTFGSKVTESLHGLSIGPSGNLYLAGYGSGSYEGQANAGGEDLFVTKITPDGETKWSKSYGTPKDDFLRAMVLDREENLYLGGFTGGSFAGRSSGGPYDISILKIDQDGKRIWARQFGGAGNDQTHAMTLDHRGNLYLTGYTDAPWEGNPTLKYGYIVLSKLDPNGAVLWTRFNDTHLTGGDGVAVETDAAGNPVLATHIEIESANATSGWQRKAAFLKYDSAGVKVWTQTLDLEYYPIIADFIIDEHDQIVLTGTTNGDLGGQANAGNADLFVMKYSPFAPSFRCAKARSPQEQLICQSEILCRLDRKIAELHDSLLNVSTTAARIKADQLKWLKTGRDAGTTPKQLDPILRERIDTLRARLAASRRGGASGP